MSEQFPPIEVVIHPPFFTGDITRETRTIRIGNSLPAENPLAPYMQVQAIPQTSEPEILLIRPSFGPEDPRWAPLIQQAREVADLACYTPIVVPAGMSVDVVSIQEVIRKLETDLPRGYQWRDVATDPPKESCRNLLVHVADGYGHGGMVVGAYTKGDKEEWHLDDVWQLTPLKWMPIPEVPK